MLLKDTIQCPSKIQNPTLDSEFDALPLGNRPLLTSMQALNFLIPRPLLYIVLAIK